MNTRTLRTIALLTAAAFVCSVGSSVAAIKITGKNVKNGSLTGMDIKNRSIRAADVANGSIGYNQLDVATRNTILGGYDSPRQILSVVGVAWSGATASIISAATFNDAGATPTVVHTGTGIVQITVPGLSTADGFNPMLTIHDSASHTQTISVSGNVVTISVFGADGSTPQNPTAGKLVVAFV